MSHSVTILLYIFIMFMCTVLAFRAQRISKDEISGRLYVHKFKKALFFLSFLIAWFFIAFSNNGVDYDNYVQIINKVTLVTFNSYSDLEIGFSLFVIFLKMITQNNPYVIIFIFKTITVVIIYVTIFCKRYEINIGYAVMSYMLLLYLPSFYLISMALAAAIVLSALAIFDTSGRIVLPALLIILAAQLHNSVYIFLPAFVAMVIINRRGSYKKLSKLILLVVYIAVILSAGTIFNFVQSTVSGFHYNNYATNLFSGSGIMVVVLFAPLFFIVYLLSKRIIEDNLKNEIFILALTSCMFNILSYRFEVIERMEFLLLSLYILYIPKVFLQTSVLRPDGERKTRTTKLALLMILYMLFRGYLVFIARTTVSSGMAYYSFFNPF